MLFELVLCCLFSDCLILFVVLICDSFWFRDSGCLCLLVIVSFVSVDLVLLVSFVVAFCLICFVVVLLVLCFVVCCQCLMFCFVLLFGFVDIVCVVLLILAVLFVRCVVSFYCF